MKANEVLDIIRGLIRPYLAFLFPTVIAGIGIYLVIRFADAELAKSVIPILTTASTMILAFYFGERASKKKEEK